MPDGQPTSPWFATAFSPVFGESAARTNAMIRVYDEAGNVIETHEHAGDSKSSQYSLDISDALRVKGVCFTEAQSKVKANISSAIKAHLLRGAFYVLVLSAGTSLAFFRPEAPANVSHKTLSFAERVTYQRAIEDVYWRLRFRNTP
jgi:hypothetical protein